MILAIQEITSDAQTPDEHGWPTSRFWSIRIPQSIQPVLRLLKTSLNVSRQFINHHAHSVYVQTDQNWSCQLKRYPNYSKCTQDNWIFFQAIRNSCRRSKVPHSQICFNSSKCTCTVKCFENNIPEREKTVQFRNVACAVWPSRVFDHSKWSTHYISAGHSNEDQLWQREMIGDKLHLWPSPDEMTE